MKENSHLEMSIHEPSRAWGPGLESSSFQKRGGQCHPRATARGLNFSGRGREWPAQVAEGTAVSDHSTQLEKPKCREPALPLERMLRLQWQEQSASLVVVQD